MNERRGDGLRSGNYSQELVFRIQRRSRMDRKHDIDADKICPEKVSCESKITCGVFRRYSGIEGYKKIVLFRRGMTEESLNCIGKIPVVRERLTMSVIVDRD